MKCQKCKTEFTPTDGFVNYCSLKCRNGRKWSETTIEKVRASCKIASSKKWEDETYRNKCIETRKKMWKEHPELFSSGEKHSKIVGQFTKGKYKGDVQSILDVSSRTASKILKRLNVGCCICGWKAASCDIHHINGKKVLDANSHWNLTCICPNHHRMFHNGKLDKSVFVPLDKHLPQNWKDLYYG